LNKTKLWQQAPKRNTNHAWMQQLLTNFMVVGLEEFDSKNLGVYYCMHKR
jgi:hypothetical protein